MSVPESNLLGDLQRTHMVHKRVYVDSLQRVFQVMIIFITIITIVITFTKYWVHDLFDALLFPKGESPRPGDRQRPSHLNESCGMLLSECEWRPPLMSNSEWPPHEKDSCCSNASVLPPTLAHTSSITASTPVCRC